jgi:hypothetical protein
MAQNACGRGGSLSIVFRAGILNTWNYSGPWGDWIFDAPVDTRITAYSLYRHVRVHSSAGPPPQASEYRSFADDERIGPGRDLCNPTVCAQLGSTPGDPRGPGNLFTESAVSLRRIGVHIACWRSDGIDQCPSWSTPLLLVYAADITLDDTYAPSIIGVNGDLAGRVSGTRLVHVRGLDRGSGLFDVRLRVDGIELARQAFDQASATCLRPFVYPVPCPLSAQSHVPLDTARLTDGVHHLQVSVTDGAGNTSRSDTYSLNVDNAGASCAYGNSAALTARFRKTGSRRTRVSLGRNVVVRGRLLSREGRVLQGALVRVLARRQGDTQYTQLKLVRTGAGGRFWFRVLARASQDVRVAYCAPGGGATRRLTLDTAASTSIKLRRRRLTNGQAMHLSGRLRGGWVPPVGKLLEMQAFFRNRWRTISSVRSDRLGRWRFRYRFDGTSGRIAYRFRASIPEEAGYPFARGRSRPIRVVVAGV